MPDSSPASSGPRTIDVATAAKAHSQIAVALMWARAALLFGVSALGVGAWPPFNGEIFWFGACAAAVGAAMLWLSSQMWRPAIARALSLLLILAGAAIGWMAWERFLPSFQIEPLFSMDAAFRAALAELNRQGSAGPWYIARVVGAIGGLLLALETLLLAWWLWRLPKQHSTLFAPLRSHAFGARTIAALLVFPAGLWRYLRTSPIALMAALLAGVLFAIAGINLVAGMWFQGFQAQVDITDCLQADSAAMAECVRGKGVIAGFGMPGLYLFAFIGFPFAALGLSRFAERRSARRAAARLGDDPRPPLVFLRSFNDDQVSLRGLPLTLMQLLLDPGWRKQNFDRLLLSECMSWAPPRALGRPEERDKVPPFGALRTYADEDPPGTPPEQSDWRRLVRDFTSRARCVVMVFDERILSPGLGVGWELDHIGRHPKLASKTLLVIHPGDARKKAGETHHQREARLRVIWERAATLAGFKVPDQVVGTLGVLPSTGSIFRGNRFNTSEYLLTLHAAIHQLDPSA